MIPPTSQIRAAAFIMPTVHAGLLFLTTRISPSITSVSSPTLLTMRIGPSISPGLTPIPEAINEPVFIIIHLQSLSANTANWARLKEPNLTLFNAPLDILRILKQILYFHADTSQFLDLGIRQNLLAF